MQKYSLRVLGLATAAQTAESGKSLDALDVWAEDKLPSKKPEPK